VPIEDQGDVNPSGRDDPVQVLILAAGMGWRLDPLTSNTPKCLVEVNGTPIVINALNILTRHPLDRIVIVIGHLGERVKQVLGDQFNGVPIEYVVNPIYDSTNNIYSLWLARDYLRIDTILIEGDVYFQHTVVSPLFSNPVGNIALVDRFKAHMDGTVVEINDRGEIDNMIPRSEQSDEFDYADKYKTVNIYSFQGRYLEQVFQPALSEYIEKHGRDIYYELVIAALIRSNKTLINAMLVNQAEWIEIDDFIDLERAEVLFSTPEQRYQRVKQLYGGYWRYDFVDYSYLYNLYFPTPPLLTELKRNMRQLLCSYPSGVQEILTYLQNWVSVDVDKLAVGNGASEIIAALKRKLLIKMTISVPTFNEYYDGLESNQVCFHYSLKNDFCMDTSSYIAAVRASNSNMAVLVNPDLPSGHLMQRQQLKELCDQLSDLDIIVLDESFIEFSSPEGEASMMAYLDEFPNLVIVRSLSKDLGVPGLRLGYAASSNSRIIDILRSELPIWNINSIAEYFLAILPKYRRDFRDACCSVMADREYLYGELKKIPNIKVYPSAANYFLIRLPPGCPSDAFREHLFINGDILVKDCSNKEGLEDRSWIRLAVRSRDQTNHLIPRFRASLSGVLASGK